MRPAKLLEITLLLLPPDLSRYNTKPPSQRWLRIGPDAIHHTAVPDPRAARLDFSRRVSDRQHGHDVLGFLSQRSPARPAMTTPEKQIRNVVGTNSKHEHSLRVVQHSTADAAPAAPRPGPSLQVGTKTGPGSDPRSRHGVPQRKSGSQISPAMKIAPRPLKLATESALWV
jgi:hypothetical protein